MRFVVRPARSRPVALRPASVVTELNALVRAGDKDAVRSDVYRAAYVNAQGKKDSRTLNQLAQFYHGKCAYCETHATMYVEHYRPVGRQPGHHTGYLWLCYEWTNLLPACYDCNDFRWGKGAKFPVLGLRQAMPPLLANGDVDTTRNALTGSYLSSEQPMLLHPEVDQPTSFLTVRPTRRRDGYRLHGTDPQKRGRKTVDTCKLNRPALALDRLAVVQQLVDDVQTAYSLLSEGIVPAAQFSNLLRVTFQQWDTRAADAKQTLTLVRQLAVSSTATFKQIVGPLLPKAQVKLITQTFAAYRAGRL